MAKVSVIIPNYNYARYLKQRIDSVLNQDYPDFEVIILDDASTDESQTIIEQYRNHPKISHICINETNSGSPFKQWNKGVELATGEYIWIAEADDFAAPSFLSRVIDVFASKPEIGLAYCQSWMVNDWKKHYPSARQYTDDLDPERWKTDYTNDGPSECMHYMLYKNTIPNASAVLFKKEIYLKAGGAPEDMAYMGDWLTWLRMLTISNIAFISEPLNYFRFHGSSVRHTNHFRPRFYYERFQVLKYLIETFNISKPDFQLVRDLILDDWLEQILGVGGKSEWQDVKATLEMAQQVDPHVKLHLLSRCTALFLQRIFKWAKPTPSNEEDKRPLLKGLFEKYVQSLWRYLAQTGPDGQPLRIALCGNNSDIQNVYLLTKDVVPSPVIKHILCPDAQLTAFPTLSPISMKQFKPNDVDAILLVGRKEGSKICQTCYDLHASEVNVIELFDSIPRVPF